MTGRNGFRRIGEDSEALYKVFVFQAFGKAMKSHVCGVRYGIEMTIAGPTLYAAAVAHVILFHKTFGKIHLRAEKCETYFPPTFPMIHEPFM